MCLSGEHIGVLYTWRHFLVGCLMHSKCSNWNRLIFMGPCSLWELKLVICLCMCWKEKRSTLFCYMFWLIHCSNESWRFNTVLVKYLQGFPAGSARLCCAPPDPFRNRDCQEWEDKGLFPEASKRFLEVRAIFVWSMQFWTSLFQYLPAVHLLTRRWAHPKAVNRRPVGSSFIMGAAHFHLCPVYHCSLFFWLDQTCLIKLKWVKPQKKKKKSTSDSGKWGFVSARCSGFCLLASAY